ncbi:citrate synthase [Coccidioides immitis RMSCC 3703]|uniref:Citrate synthase n=1 Tax=Coccidioides immitis RMSCC 3703 TaxID=454286 RepID=A0A0J8R2A3_COCIT|nr:citrate synthase [Coccidioides immitis RMSCC 3703]
MALAARASRQALRAAKASSSRTVAGSSRSYASAAESELKSVFRSVLPAKRALLKELKEHNDAKIGDVTVANAIGGMRGLKAMIWEGSVLDPEEGIRFHGHTIKDCQQMLPKGTSGTEMLPEAMFWLLLTGQVPTTPQIRAFSRELAEKSHLPKHILDMIKSFPKDMHPMTQLSVAVAALNTESTFAKKYAEGLNKADYWEPTFDDSISLLAKIPRVAALVFRPNEVDTVGTQQLDSTQDWAYNFAVLLGKGGKEHESFHDVLRLYLALHGDHEGGNVSAHATHLVGSALSDPFLSYSAGLLGLAGPLHGLAAQEVLRWILNMRPKIGDNFTEKDVKDYLWSTLKSGQVVPGYGHAPRPEIMNNPVFKTRQEELPRSPLVSSTEHGKTKNPHPNVDASSGVLFHHYGFQEPLYYTVTFGVSRALGPLAQLIWSRALGLPIERPKSINMQGLLNSVKKN